MATELLNWIGLDYLVNSHKRLYWGYMLLSLLIAVAYLRAMRQTIGSFFSKEIWWHPSARLDYRFFLLASLIKIGLILPLLLGVGEVAFRVLMSLQDLFGYQAKLSVDGLWLTIGYTLSLFLVGDLSRYWLHRLMHRVPFLWALHKVHHSAEVLTPMTFYRVHPLENLLFGLRYALSAGLVTGVFLYYFGAGLEIVELFGANAFVIVAHLLGDNLRHSHVALRYPRWLERILISPAQHQYHHSLGGSRRNYGGVLALWDSLFGSVRISSADDVYRFGVGDSSGHDTLFGLLFTPLVEISRPLFRQFSIRQSSNRLFSNRLFSNRHFLMRQVSIRSFNHEKT